MQCTLWATYALPIITKCKLQPLVTNVMGAALYFAYVGIFIAYGGPRRPEVLRGFFGAVAFIVVTILLAVFAAPPMKIQSWPDAGESSTTTFLGWVCSLLNIGFYAAPLSVARQVLRTKSVKYMPLLLTCGCGLLSVFWTIYAFLAKDYFILTPNALGLFLFALQLAVYLYARAAGRGLQELDDDKDSNLLTGEVTRSTEESNDVTSPAPAPVHVDEPPSKGCAQQ